MVNFLFFMFVVFVVEIIVVCNAVLWQVVIWRAAPFFKRIAETPCCDQAGEREEHELRYVFPKELHGDPACE